MITTINEFKQYIATTMINEKLKSSILREIYNMLKNDKYLNVKKLDHISYYKDWAEITDDDFKKVTTKEARSKQYENNLIFWISDKNGKLDVLGITTGKQVHNIYGYRIKRNEIPSSLQLSNDASFAYILIDETTQNRNGLRSIRYSTRDGAIAFLNPDKIAADNKERYNSILALRNSNSAEVDKIVKDLMDKYTQELLALELPKDEESKDKIYSSEDGSIGKLVNDVNKISDILKYLLKQYKEYLYILSNSKSGTLYNHQKDNLDKLKKQFKRWSETGVVLLK